MRRARDVEGQATWRRLGGDLEVRHSGDRNQGQSSGRPQSILGPGYRGGAPAAIKDPNTAVEAARSEEDVGYCFAGRPCVVLGSEGGCDGEP